MTEPEQAAAARAFLWENWRHKRRVSCVVLTRTIEGEPRPVNYQVRPDTQGRWHVSADWEWWCCWFYGMEGKAMEKRSGSTTYYGIRRLDKATRQPIPDNEPRKPETYLIVLEPTLTRPVEKPVGKLL